VCYLWHARLMKVETVSGADAGRRDGMWVVCCDGEVGCLYHWHVKSILPFSSSLCEALEQEGAM
jgi:hypothetical protein